MVQTLLTGGTGTLGKALRPRLLEAGHTVRATSRSSRSDGDVEWVTVDLASGDGIESALADIDLVIHTASAPRGDSEAVDVRGTDRLLKRAAAVGVSNFLYVSIVGIDEIPLTYYEHKLAAEKRVESSDVPSTILRSTQFHQFLDELLAPLYWLPVWPLPTEFRVQPIHVEEVADTIVEHATFDPGGRVAPVGGPEVLTLGEIARAYRSARGLRRPIVRLPIPGSIAAAVRSGTATSPDRAVGTTTWTQWVTDQYDTPTS